MNIKILDSWLRDYLETTATPQKIAEYLSLCGPSVEKVEKLNGDYVYDIEITSNRVDTASVYGIAREASAILPRFKTPAKLKKVKTNQSYIFTDKVSYLDVQVDRNLCPRFTAVLIKSVKIGESPSYIKSRLEASGIRSLNNVIDISNYIMITLGQPVHTFDYDKIGSASMILRQSQKGESITTLDGKEFTLSGGDIVIEDGEGRLIDLAGIMGGKLSAVDENTKNVLLFVQTYNPVNIRKTSMVLAQRTAAATIFEKGIDPELVSEGILMGIDLIEKITKGKAEREILNIYPSPYKTKEIIVTLETINKILGTVISKSDITQMLKSLEFELLWRGNTLTVLVPSYRSNDFNIAEDIIEEIARLYGYHNLPSELMTGSLPAEAPLSNFSFERKIKSILEGWGGTEVYTLSLVPKNYVSDRALKIKNPLGEDTEYLRTDLMPSLIQAAKDNFGTFSDFHIFEIANIYLPRTNDLPEERLILGGVFEGYEYRKAKGYLEALLEKLSINYRFKPEESKGYSAGKSLTITSKGRQIGKFGIVYGSKLIYYEFDMKPLEEVTPKSRKYSPVPKYPAQIEDITLVFPEKTKIGEVIDSVYSQNRLVRKAELKDVYENNYTLNIEYQDPTKTLTDGEVEKIRNEILRVLRSKFGASIRQ